MQPKVSVIMPSLNVYEYIKECMDSVLTQTLKDIEIICIDAGSTDGTAEILNQYAEKDSRIKIINSEIKSYGYQVNLGLSIATGKYFAIVETDDYIINSMFEELYILAEEYQLDVLKTDFMRFYGDGDSRNFEYRPLYSSAKYKNLYGKVLNCKINKDVFWANGLNQPGIYRLDFIRNNDIRLNETAGASYQDNGLWFQMIAFADRIYFHNKAYYMLRRDNPNSSVKDKGKVYALCIEYDFIRSIIDKNPETVDFFAPICAYFRFGNYCFTLNRIADEYKRDFLKRFSDDFKKIKIMGELDESLFSSEELSKLQSIMNDPELYYFTNYYFSSEKNPKQLKDEINALQCQIKNLQDELNIIKNLHQYKIMKKLSFIKNAFAYAYSKINSKGLGACLLKVKEHGVKNAINKLKQGEEKWK